MVGVDFALANGDSIAGAFTGWNYKVPNAPPRKEAWMVYVTNSTGATGWDDLRDNEASRFPISLVVEYEMDWCPDQSSNFQCNPSNFDLVDLCPTLRDDAFLVAGPPPGITSGSVNGECPSNRPRGKYFDLLYSASLLSSFVACLLAVFSKDVLKK
jgi:hypothetical protein